MGYIKRNGINYFGDNSISLTQAQYDALVQSGEMDPNTTYYIVDSGSILSVDLIYPIGSIFMSVNNVNPGTYLVNTTWVAWGAGRVPIGIDTNDADFNVVEKTGGEKTHTLNVNEMPSHTHRLEQRQQWYSSDSVSGTSTGTIYSWKAGEGTGGSTSKSYQCNHDDVLAKGGSQAHNNLQPYITCYMWKRIS